MFHEVRDPIHVFIRYGSDERKVIDSLPFQRLRHIHQLGMTYLLYPGASHRRFEHSLGVMDLASRVFDIVTNRDIADNRVISQIGSIFSHIKTPEEKYYWRRTLRMAALCHDLGHLPFSHGAEKDLLPEGWSHERLTVQIITSPQMGAIWGEITPPLRAKDIAKIAVGPKIIKESFTEWELLLSEIITGDAFGVDRIDYLLRDSYHTGVMYGKFDHNRLIDTLRILPMSESSATPTLGVESGGIYSAEALLLARYFMYMQVYLHPVRRIYDIHLCEYLKETLNGEFLPIDIETFLKSTDEHILSNLAMHAMKNDGSQINIYAKRIACRNHFKVLYERKAEDEDIFSYPGSAIYNAAATAFSKESVRHESYFKAEGPMDFPVLGNDGKIASSLLVSKTLKHIPYPAIDYVFIDPIKRDEGRSWLEKNKKDILEKARKEVQNGQAKT